jgi:hypothetical protein
MENLRSLCTDCNQEFPGYHKYKCSECGKVPVCIKCIKSVLLETLGETERRAICKACINIIYSILKAENAPMSLEKFRALKKSKEEHHDAQINNLDTITIHHKIRKKGFMIV